MRWPDEAQVWMAYGNSLYASKDYQQAEAAFRTAITLTPANAQGWNNLAYALLRTACPQQARQAAACAANLAPSVSNYRDTITEINALANGSNKQHCKPITCETIINDLKPNEPIQ